MAIDLQAVRLIGNDASSTHDTLLSELIASASNVLIASPFLFDDFEPWVSRVDFSRTSSLRLVTTIAPRGDDQLRKPSSLISLLGSMQERWPHVQVTVQVDNKLHGKVFLFWQEGCLSTGVVTSANLTQSGLWKNHEWGIALHDLAILESLHRQIDAAVEYPYISNDLLRQMALIVDQYRRDNPSAPEQRDIDVLHHALKTAPLNRTAANSRALIDTSQRVFLKPWGTKDRPVLKAGRESFSTLEERLDFPKTRPTDVRKGDLVIAFGTGSRCVLSLYRVLRPPEERPANEQESDLDVARWPWFVAGENLTPGFGRSWWEHDLTIDRLAEEFRGLAPDSPHTAAGALSLGAFNFGAGRLHLSDAFGVFLVEKLLAIEEELPGAQLNES